MLTQRENLHIHVAGITLNLFEIILSVTRKSLIVPLIAKVIEPALQSINTFVRNYSWRIQINVKVVTEEFLIDQAYLPSYKRFKLFLDK